MIKEQHKVGESRVLKIKRKRKWVKVSVAAE